MGGGMFDKIALDKIADRIFDGLYMAIVAMLSSLAILAIGLK